jgi:hypothetical protein
MVTAAAGSRMAALGGTSSLRAIIGLLLKPISIHLIRINADLITGR